MRTSVRLVAAVLAGALGIATATLLIAPQASALLRAGRTGGERLDLDPLAERSLVFAADGSLLAVLHFDENRAPVRLGDVPRAVVDVVLAVEDDRFFDHGGVNLRATARALASNVEAGDLVQGGSTVTQQVVKNSLLSPEKKLGRKLREAALAWRLEHELSKREILERYLNTVYFGNGAYGLQAAAETYFSKDVGELTLIDAALLAAVIRNPVGYDPFRNPDVARERRRLVLSRLVDVGRISATEAARLAEQPIPSARGRALPEPDGYFVEAVKQQLLDDPRLGETAQERFNAVFRGGLRIHTTLDPARQAAAEAAVREQLPDTGGEFTAALVSLEPATGAVHALVGGPGFERAKYNLATQARRQPGSSFKPIVLAAALQAGYSTRDTINGIGPCRIDVPGMAEPWEPENYEGTSGSVTTLEWATARSLNCAYARLGLIVGLDKVRAMARALGIEGPIDPVAAMSLGSEEVTPLEMAGAYATFANDGVFRKPYLVERVLDPDGDEVLRGRSAPHRAMSVQAARMATATLETVVRSGTGARARLYDRTVAGKTGTAQNHSNAWFVGFTPQLATAVWMGAPVGNVPMTSVGGISVTGGSYPAMIWRSYMATALAGEPALDLVAPDWSDVGYSQYLRLPDERSRSFSSWPRSDDAATAGGPTTTRPGGSPTTTTAPKPPAGPPTTSSPPPTTSPPTTEPPPPSTTAPPENP